MKRMIAILMMVVFILSLSACSETGGETTQTNEKSPENEGGNNEEEVLDEVTIKFTYPGSPQEDEEMVEEAINEYLKDKININIDLDPIEWSAYLEKTNLMMATGDELDLVFTASWYDYYSNVSKKAYLPLNDLIDEYAPKTKEILHPALFDGPKVEGVIYGLPTNKEIATANGIFFNEDLMEKYDFSFESFEGVSDLRTKVEPMLEIIKANEPGIYPIYINGMNSFVRMWENEHVGIGDVLSPGVYEFETSQIVYAQETETYREIAEIIYDWYQKGYINEDAMTADQWVPNMFCTWSPFKPGKDKEMSASYGVNLVGYQMHDAVITTTTVTGSMMAISRTSENPERAMMFLELLNTDKYLNNLLNFGIEDVHYVKIDENRIDFPEGFDASNSKYYPGAMWMFQNQFLNYLRKEEDEDKWDQFREFNDSAIVSETVGFNFDNSDVKVELAACNNVLEEYERAIRSGMLNPEEAIPIYIEKLKANGSEVIIAEKQRQVNEFLGIE